MKYCTESRTPAVVPTGKLRVFSEWKPHITSIFRHRGVSVRHFLSTKKNPKERAAKNNQPVKAPDASERITHSVHSVKSVASKKE